MGNQIIRKGWLSMPVSLIKGNTRDFWFVLTADSLNWYKDNDVREFPLAYCRSISLVYCISGWERADKNNECFLSDSMIAVFMYVCASISFPFLIIPFLIIPFQEKELKYTMKLEDMKVKDVEASRFSIGKKHIFALFYTTGR